LLGRALALAHARFLRLLGDRLVREHARPDLAAAGDEARHRDARRLDLAVGQPAGLERLEPVVAERHVGPRQALPAIRPRCCLRYLTFFGINMMLVPRYARAGGRRGARSLYSSSRPTRGMSRSPL